VIGPRQALDMLLTGRNVSAKEAKEFGLINRIVPKHRLVDEATKLALSIAKYSSFTVQFGKKAFYDQVDLDKKTGYQNAIKAIVENCMHPDAEEGIRAMLEKRKPTWEK
jgi:enoyl-CoA hydratase/carnithine racemase